MARVPSENNNNNSNRIISICTAGPVVRGDGVFTRSTRPRAGITAGLRLQPVITTVLMPPRTVTAIDGARTKAIITITLRGRPFLKCLRNIAHLGNAERTGRIDCDCWREKKRNGETESRTNRVKSFFFFANATPPRIYGCFDISENPAAISLPNQRLGCKSVPINCKKYVDKIVSRI